MQRLFKVFVAVGVCGVSVLAACSLGLDASKLTLAEEGGVNPGVDAGGDVPLKPGEIRCQNKQDCNDGGCLEGDCIGGVCKYEVCPTAAFPCQHRACADNKCSQPSPHHFVAQHMVLGTAGLGCNDSLGACVAVSYPFVFVGPKTGEVAAYPLTDLASPALDGGFAPPAVKLQNVSFSPTRIVANHDRVWLLGPLATRGSTREVPIAWIEVPTNPQVSSLPASVGTLTLPSTGDIAGAVPGANKGLIVLLNDGSAIPRAAQVAVVDGGVSPDTTFNLLADYDGGAPIVAASGDRLITARFESGPPAVPDTVYNMNIIASAGTANAATLGEVNFAAPFGKLYNGVTFAETPKGSVIAQGAVAAVEDGGVIGVDSVRVAWVIEGGDGKLRGANPLGGVPVIQYVDGGLPQTPPTIGPITAVGDDAIFALQGEGDAGTSVRVVRRNPTTAAIDPTSQTSLDQPPFTYVIAGAVSEVTSKLYGYAFTKPTAQADGVHVTIFELGCGQ